MIINDSFKIFFNAQNAQRFPVPTSEMQIFTVLCKQNICGFWTVAQTTTFKNLCKLLKGHFINKQLNWQTKSSPDETRK